MPTKSHATRRHPPALVQCHKGDEPYLGHGLAYDAQRLYLALRFILKQFTTANGPITPRDHVVKKRLKAITNEHLPLQQAMNNAESWLAAARILQDIEAHSDATTVNFANAVLGCLFESRLRQAGTQRLQTAQAWDVADIAAELHELGKLHGFQPQFPLNPFLTQVQEKQGIPTPNYKVPTSLPAPRTQSHAAASKGYKPT